MSKDTGSLPLGKLIGYSIGACGDYTAYGFIYSFLSFYLTTIAGISPAMSGVIISIAIAWDAVTDPICGITVDISRCKYGRRRPMILASSIPLGVSIVLLFTKIDASVTVKNIYYLVLVLVFWTAYTWFNIPYYSLGSIICRTDDDRTKLAGIRQVFSFIGNFFCGTVVTFMVGKLVAAGISEASAWNTAAIFLCVIVIATILLSWRITRGCEPMDTAPESESFRTLFSQIGQVMRNKPYILLICAALCFNVYTAFYNANLMYYVIYRMGLTETSASALFLSNTVVSIVTIPLFVKLGLSWDKKKLYVACLGLSGAVMVATRFIGLGSLTAAILYAVLVAIGTACYWMFIFNLVYDCIDYDEAKTGVRKDGVHMSFYSFLLKLGGAVASLVMGLMLQHSGFDAEAAVQTQSALSSIDNMFTLLPGIFMIISAIAMSLSPLSKEKMAEICTILEERRK